MLGLMRVPDRGIRRQKGQAPLKGAVIDVMQEEQLQLQDYVSIYRAGISGTVRLPVRLPCVAGAGSGAGAGIAPPAIRAYGGEFSVGKEGISP